MPQQNSLFFDRCHNWKFVIIMLILYTLYLGSLWVVGGYGVSSDKSNDLENLKLLHIIARHGARNPLFFYPNDPHKNYNFVGGVGQLTNDGKLQQYSVGQFLRKRYRNFLTSNPREVYARSSALDRTLESAMVALSGLYPPMGDWIWNRNLNWQPISVYSTPQNDDYLLYYHPPCPAFNREYRRYAKTEMMQTNYRECQDFFKFLSNQTGMEINEFYQVLMVYSTLHTEERHNLPLPDWATDRIMEEMRKVSDKAMSFLYGTKLLQRLRGGPLIGDVINNIESKLNGSLEQKKLFFYSTHDAVLAAVLSALQLYTGGRPSFSAFIIFEFHSVQNQNFIRIIYSNSSTPENNDGALHLLQMPGCKADCPLETFIKLTKDVVPIDPKKECL